MELVIKHDENENKFFVTVNGHECHLKYVKWNERVWDLINTFIPNNIREARSLASNIVKHTLDFARKQDIRIKASCACVQDFLMENKEYRSLIYYPY